MSDLASKIHDVVNSSSGPVKELVLRIHGRSLLPEVERHRDRIYVKAGWNEASAALDHPGFKSITLEEWKGEVLEEGEGEVLEEGEGEALEAWEGEELCTVLATYPFQRFRYWANAVKSFQIPGRILEALSLNTSLEELRLYTPFRNTRDNFGEEESAFAAVNGQSALRKLLRPHSTLSSLHILDWPLCPSELALLASALASSSPPLKIFKLLQAPQPLKILELQPSHIEGIRALLASFATNTTLLSLLLGLSCFADDNIPAPPPDLASTFASALSTNTTLHSLQLFAGSSMTTAIVSSEVLSSNKTLQGLTLTSYDDLHGYDKLIQDMNKTLTSLTIGQYDSRESSPLLQAQAMSIIKALEKNTTLTSFGFGSPAVDGKEMYEAIIDLLSINVTLKTLDLSVTDLSRNSAWMSTINNMLRSSNENEGLRAALSKFPTVPPTTTRVFFCGQTFAGKTTLRKTMVNLLLDDNVGKRVKQLCNFVANGNKHSASRTTGIEVTSVNHSGLEIFFWDLAGQREYHAFHDLMFPNEQGPSLFLIVCSLMRTNSQQVQGLNSSSNHKTYQEISGELRYWLRYISSNTKKISRRTPHVTFIFTHEDMLVAGLKEPAIVKGWAEDCTNELKEEFNPVAKVVGTFFVNAREPGSVRRVVQHALDEFEQIVNSCQPIFSACNNARKMLSEWMKDHPHEPWMEESDFIRLCRRKLPDLEFIRFQRDAAIIDSIRAVLMSLHHTGSLIYFQNLHIVLINLQWFCKEFMGGMLDRTTQVTQESASDDHKGVWKRGDVKCILEGLYNDRKLSTRKQPNCEFWSKCVSRKTSTNIKSEGPLNVEHLVNIMLQLELCYEVDCGVGLFIPATLCQSEWQQPHRRRWTADLGPTGEFGYVGRRLECDDEKHTFLTPGFFPRLQVHLKNIFQGPYEPEKDVIRTVDDRLEVLIEFNEAPTSFIDIMVRFPKSKNLDRVLEFISNKVVQNIRSLQIITGCWQGVNLVEVALRPSCVEKLILPQMKMKQRVSLEELRSRLFSADPDDIATITYPWDSLEAANLGPECTPIIDLLGEKHVMGLLAEGHAKVEELSKQLGICDYGASSSRSNNITNVMNPGFGWPKRSKSMLTERGVFESRMESGMDRIEGKIDAIARDMKDVKGAVARLLEQKRRLMPEVEKLLRKIQNLNSSDHQVENAQLPQFFVFIKEESLLTRLVPGLSHFKIHFMCENQEIPHLPRGQEGIEITALDDGAVKSILPYMQFLLSTLSLCFKLGAPLAQAHGLMVPNLSTLIDSLISASGGIVDRSKVPRHENDEDACTIHSGNIGLDPVVIKKARIWLQEFMQEKRCDKESKIHDKFGLLRKQFKDGRCVWLCDDHFRLQA